MHALFRALWYIYGIFNENALPYRRFIRITTMSFRSWTLRSSHVLFEARCREYCVVENELRNCNKGRKHKDKKKNGKYRPVFPSENGPAQTRVIDVQTFTANDRHCGGDHKIKYNFPICRRRRRRRRLVRRPRAFADTPQLPDTLKIIINTKLKKTQLPSVESAKNKNYLL